MITLKIGEVTKKIGYEKDLAGAVLDSLYFCDANGHNVNEAVLIFSDGEHHKLSAMALAYNS